MSEEKIEKYVIFDHDGGTDDAWALLMLLQAEKHLKNIKILAITCVKGNTSIENVIKNIYHILRLMDRIDIPIYKGASEALIKRSIEYKKFHGDNGMGNIDFWKPEYPSNEKDLIQPENAMQIIRDLVVQYPNKVSLLGIGPLTNFALAIKFYPEIKNLVKDIYLMGGNWKGRGNVTACAEFNFYLDAEAAHIVLSSFSGIPITIVPLEPTIEGGYDLNWRFEVFKESTSPIVQLLNEAEKFVFRNHKSYFLCDAYLTAVYLFPEQCILKKNVAFATVELQGFEARGQMVLDYRRRSPNVTIIEQLNSNEIQNKIIWTATA